MTLRDEKNTGSSKEAVETKNADTRAFEDETTKSENAPQEGTDEDSNQPPQDMAEATPAPGPDEDDDLSQADKNEPEASEHLDLSHISDSTALNEVVVYMAEDKGDGLMHPEDHNPLAVFCDTKDADLLKGTTPEEVAEGILPVVQRRYKDMNLLASKQNARMTLYRIEMGHVFLKLKRLVRKKGKWWKEWVATNVTFINERTLTDYMLLAKHSNIEKYALLGKERLLMIVRAIKGLELADSDDPIGEFLRGSDINYDPESDEDFHELEVQIDTGVEMTKLAKRGITTIPKDKVELLVRKRKSLRATQLAALNMCPDKEAAFDQILTDGKVIPPMTAATAAKALKKGTGTLSKAVSDLTQTSGYANVIDEETRDEIRDLIAALQALTEEQAAEAA